MIIKEKNRTHFKLQLFCFFIVKIFYSEDSEKTRINPSGSVMANSSAP